MKKRSRYNQNAYKFHRYVLSRKRNDSRDIIEKIECKLRRRFGLYKRLLNEDKLEELTHLRLTEERRKALKDLYSYDSKAFCELRIELTTDENNRKSNLCPNCLLELAGTLDHIIPQAPFPEYSTNPYNLIPCCSTCNSKKNDDWIKDGKRSIIDFYIDDIPDIQFLYAYPKLVKGYLDITYEIHFPLGYDITIKDRLENHFGKLELLKRYRENSDDKISELEHHIKISTESSINDGIVKDIIIKKANEMQKRLGVNYWVAILNIACVSDDVIYNYLKRR